MAETLLSAVLLSRCRRPTTARGGEGGLGVAVPILAEPGTCIVFDKDLLHAGAPNLSPAIRYALYARMRWEVEME